MTTTIDARSNAPSWPAPSVPRTPLTRLRGIMAAGNTLVFAFVIGLGTWFVLAPLESAAIADGTVEAETSRKVIQHLEGGIVQAILVRDGDAVTAGQVLIRLDSTKARSEFQSLAGQYWDGKAREFRLLAERDGQDKISFPELLLQARATSPAMDTILAGQEKIFATRRQQHRSQIAVIEQRMAQVDQEIAGLQAQETAAARRAGIIKEERTAVATLVEKGLERRSRLLTLERKMVEIDGRRGEAAAQIARARQVISEAQANLMRLASDRQNEIALSLRETQTQNAVLLERLHAVKDQLARTEVKAPEDGVVTDLRIHTTGGVIGAGEPLMDLVPKQDDLIVVARLRPEDIDVVRVGLPAEVHLLPYSQRRVPPLQGTVDYISADRLVDRRSDQPYYAAKIRLAPPRGAPAAAVVAGMPVQAFVKTGTGTAAGYALRPLRDSFTRAFRED